MVASRPFDPHEYLRIADVLISLDSSEASLRTAVGRLYYAAFLSVRESLGMAGRSRIHGRVIGEMRRRDRTAAVQFDTLRNLRLTADYELEVQDPLRRDWQRNYRIARQLAAFILARVP